MMLDVDVQALVDNHLDLMKIVDKLKVIKLLKLLLMTQAKQSTVLSITFTKHEWTRTT
jgi:hypothetical protein